MHNVKPTSSLLMCNSQKQKVNVKNQAAMSSIKRHITFKFYNVNFPKHSINWYIEHWSGDQHANNHPNQLPDTLFQYIDKFNVSTPKWHFRLSPCLSSPALTLTERKRTTSELRIVEIVSISPASSADEHILLRWPVGLPVDRCAADWGHASGPTTATHCHSEFYSKQFLLTTII